MIKIIAVINVLFAGINCVIPLIIDKAFVPLFQEIMKGEPMPSLTQLMIDTSAYTVWTLFVLSLIVGVLSFARENKMVSKVLLVISLVTTLSFPLVSCLAMYLPFVKIGTTLGG